MLKVHGNKGFQVTFENGITVSVMFGRGNYCHRLRADYPGDAKSEDAEIAIFRKFDETWLTRLWKPSLCDDVAGYCSPGMVADAMFFTMRLEDDVEAPKPLYNPSEDEEGVAE